MTTPKPMFYDPHSGWKDWSDGIEVGQVWRCKQDGHHVVVSAGVIDWVWLTSEFTRRRTKHRRATFKRRYERVDA